MKQRRVMILFVIIACICASAATGLYFTFRKPPTEEHYLRLREGMSREEVESILGGGPSEIHAEGEIWYGTYGSIRAHFNENDRLAKCILYPPDADPLVSLFERIEEDVRVRLNPNPNEFPSIRGPYDECKMIVPPEDKGVIPPKRMVIFETDGASSTRR